MKIRVKDRRVWAKITKVFRDQKTYNRNYEKEELARGNKNYFQFNEKST